VIPRGVGATGAGSARFTCLAKNATLPALFPS